MTGQRIVFPPDGARDRRKLFQAEMSFHPGAPGEPLHLHPGQEERCHVVAGRGRFEVGGASLEADPGRDVIVPPGTQHSLEVLDDEEFHMR